MGLKNLEDFIEFLKKDCNPNGNSKIPRPEKDLVFCDWRDCLELGQYIRCYFDLFKNCPKYISHQNHLKYVRGLMKKEKKRHHPRR